MAERKVYVNFNFQGNAIKDFKLTTTAKATPATDEGVFAYNTTSHRPTVVTNVGVDTVVLQTDLTSYLSGTSQLNGDITGTPGATQIATGVIINSDISAGAAIAWTKIDKTGSNLTDMITRQHSALQNLTNDDHTQYALVTGSRAFTGKQQGVDTAPGDPGTTLATKTYVDAQMLAAKRGMDTKEAVYAVATTNITLSGLQTIDTISVPANVRVGVVGNTVASQNGIWISAATGWTRATDADDSTKVTSGMQFSVTNGSDSYKGSEWLLTTDDPITVGTTALNFIMTKGAGSVTGISLGGAPVYSQMSGNQLQFKGLRSTSGAITIAAGTTLVDFTFNPNVIDVNSLASPALGVAKGGTGATTAALALKNLGAPTTKYFNFGYSAGAPTLKTWLITHNLANTAVAIEITDDTGNPVDFAIATVDANSFNIVSNYALTAADVFSVVVQGVQL